MKGGAVTPELSAVRVALAKEDEPGACALAAEQRRGARVAGVDRRGADRARWRVETFRRLTHPLPGQRLLLVGGAALAAELARATRGECPVVAWSPADEPAPPAGPFDHALVAELPAREAKEALAVVAARLAPGGHLVAYGRPARTAAAREALRAAAEAAGLSVQLVRPHDAVPRRLPGGWLWRNLAPVVELSSAAPLVCAATLLHARRGPGAPPDVDLADPTSALRSAVSVVIPCRNEEASIGPLVRRLLALHGPLVREVIVVDDGSADRTAEVVERLGDRRVRCLRRGPPNGVGRALRDGYAAATGDWVLSLDADFVELVPELRELFEVAARGDADVVVGSRFDRRGLIVGYPAAKAVANRGFHALARVCLGLGFRDLTNNLKLMRREVVERLRLVQPGFAANAETGLQPLLMGLSVVEVPVSWIDRAPGMGASSFKLARVGGGYCGVLRDALLARAGLGPYAALPRLGARRATTRGEP